MKNKTLIKLSAAAMVMAALTGSQALAQYQVTTLGSAVVENFSTINLNTNSYTTNNSANVINFTNALGSTTSAQRNAAWTVNVGNANFGRAVGGVGNYGTNVSSGGIYTPGQVSSTDRSLGFVGTGNAPTPTFVAQFQNVTGSTVTSFLLGYTGEQFQEQSSLASFITVRYSTTSAAAALTGTTLALNFNALFNSATTARNGDAAANRSVLTAVNTTGLSLANGTNLWIAFTGNRGTAGAGSAQGLAVDDVSLTFNGTVSNNSKFTVDGTSVATATTATVDLGKVFTGGSFTAGSATVTKSGSDAGTFTATAGAGVTATPTSGSATSSLSVNLTDTATSGAKTGSVTVANTTANATDADDTITVNGTVLDRASVTGNNSSPIAAGSSATLTNAAGANRATAKITGTSFSGDTGFGVTGLTAGTTIAAGANTSGTITFTGGLNGATYTGSMLVSLEHADQTIGGATPNDITGVSFNLTKTVSGATSNTGSAVLSNGTTYNGIGLTNSSGNNTVATLLDGTASGSTTLGFTFVATTTATNGSDRVSDILDLTTPGLFVLQLAYNESGAQSTAGGESSVFLGWNNGGLFNNAILGNTANSSYANSKFFGSYAAFLGTLTGFTGDLSTIMGAYGVDTVNNTVWAVLNHNSEFTVVPEPSTYAMLFAGLLMLVCVVRRKQANA